VSLAAGYVRGGCGCCGEPAVTGGSVEFDDGQVGGAEPRKTAAEVATGEELRRRELIATNLAEQQQQREEIQQ